MPNIKTTNGIMDSCDAVKLFTQEGHPTSLLLGIYHQLLEISQSDAARVTAYINQNPKKFSRPITKLAKKHCFSSPPSPRPTRSTTWPDGLEEGDILLLESVPGLCYDSSLFRTVCAKLERGDQADLWLDHIKDPNAPIPLVLGAVPYLFRKMFARKFAEQFQLSFA